MKTFYRVEHADTGIGPYNGGDLDNMSHLLEMPIPVQDRRLRDSGAFSGYLKTSDYRYAFGSLEQLTAWFRRGDRHHLDKIGYHVVKFRAEGYHGTNQAVYFKHTRNEIETIKLTEV